MSKQQLHLCDEYEVLTANGWQSFEGIMKTSHDSAIALTFDDNSELVVSHGHRMLVNESFVAIEHINTGDYLNNKIIIEKELSAKEEDIRLYDLLNVAGGNAYIGDGIIHHNCEFLGSAGTLISGKTLRNMVYMDAMELLFENKFHVYERPQVGSQYMIIADTSHGKELDASAFLIMNVSHTPYKIAAKFSDNTIIPEIYPNVLVASAKHYNDAFILAENNDIGAMVLNIMINDLEYENIIYTDDYKKEKEITNQFGKTAGVRTTPKVKRQGCLSLKSMIENDQLIVQDFQTIEELSTFIIHKNKQYAADADKHDDLVICLVLFAWATTQTFFKDMVNSDMRLKLAHDKAQQIEDALPAPIMSHNDQTLPANHYVDGGQIWEIAGTQGINDDVDNDHAWSGRYSGY